MLLHGKARTRKYTGDEQDRYLRTNRAKRKNQGTPNNTVQSNSKKTIFVKAVIS